MKHTGISCCLLLALTGCSSLTIKDVSFGWPVESVVSVSQTNMVDDVRYAVAFRVAAIAMEEFGDSTALSGATVRLIRNAEGYYFLTGERFRHVYVLTPGKSELSLHQKVLVDPNGLTNPAMNQRPPLIELLDMNMVKARLSSDGIVKEDRQ
jgi:hypothetical protein